MYASSSERRTPRGGGTQAPSSSQRSVVASGAHARFNGLAASTLSGFGSSSPGLQVGLSVVWKRRRWLSRVIEGIGD
ncbi:hypothetical protein N7530_002617 [Penicillium desertorum]|uniref:Uncharacterized protein n=1 Tax=Penicillium desertorum TaxID=1303715 RepID=A0A9X0BTD9_9EURO|nr:hypothetical protein N7530_002617 [Penicillium desertorum]